MLDDPREEAFVLKWHETGNKAEAYRYAYPRSKNWKPDTVYPKATNLSKRDKIKARYEELQTETAETHGITVKTLLDELVENRTIAIEVGQLSAANAATMGKAKLCGLDIQKVDHSGSVTITKGASLDDFYSDSDV